MNRLDHNDAKHVQCLHTNRGFLGTYFPCGHSDYFPNMGFRQSGCDDSFCDHKRATYIFQSSLYPENIFNAVDCHNDTNARLRTCGQNIDRFGIHGMHSIGQFYFDTTACYPYCLNCTNIQ